MNVKDYEDKIAVGAEVAVRLHGNPNFHNKGFVRSVLRNTKGEIIQFIVDWCLQAYGYEIVNIIDGEFWDGCVEVLWGEPTGDMTKSLTFDEGKVRCFGVRFDGSYMRET